MAEEAKKRSITIIIDSNFLFVPLQFGVDIFEELRRLLGGSIRCVVPSTVLEELQLLRRDSKPSVKKQIDFALSLAERCEKIEVDVVSGETVDDSIVRMARLLRCPVATNDAELRRRLRAEMTPVIYMRQKAYLEMDGVVQRYY